MIVNKIEIEVFFDNIDILETQICALQELLPEHIKFSIEERLAPYPMEELYANYSALEILQKERERLLDNKRYRQRIVSAKGKIEKVEFINMLESAGFTIINKYQEYAS